MSRDRVRREWARPASCVDEIKLSYPLVFDSFFVFPLSPFHGLARPIVPG